MIEKISLPKVSVSVPKKGVNINERKAPSPLVADKYKLADEIYKKHGVIFVPCSDVPFFKNVKNMDEIMVAYDNLNKELRAHGL